MNKTNLLSIGTLSKLTGVHIKSLRYYDEIGILPPAYVNPDTGYRYYAVSQIHVVDAIQLCVELGIPLRQFSEFVNPEGRRIHYAKLLETGTELAIEKIHRLQEHLDFLRSMREEFSRSHALQADGNRGIFPLAEKLCLTIPYDGPQHTFEYFRGISRLFSRMEQEHLKPGYDFGLLLICREQENPRQYLFCELKADSPRPDTPDLITLPAARYCFLQTSESSITQAPSLFPELFAKPYDKVVVEVESTLEISDPSEPSYELRCSLPPDCAPSP